MSVSASGALVPSDIVVQFFDPLELLGRLVRIARHIGEVGTRHRFRRAAAVGAGYAGKRGYCEQDNGKFSQHVALSGFA